LYTGIELIYNRGHMNEDLNFYFVYLTGQRKHSVQTMFNTIGTRLYATPASTKYHSSCIGGLLSHTIEVARLACALYPLMGKLPFTIESLVFCALVHDIGKIGSPTDDMYLPNRDPVKAEKEPFIYNTALKPNMSHEEWTLYYLQEFDIKVTPDELFAILNHAGPYNPTNGRFIETPLQIVLHSADNLAAKIPKI
jgi:hypothetical protein